MGQPTPRPSVEREEAAPKFVIGNKGFGEPTPFAARPAAKPANAATPQQQRPQQPAPFVIGSTVSATTAAAATASPPASSAPSRPGSTAAGQGQGGDSAFMSEEQFVAELNSTSGFELPLMVMAIAGALLCLFHGYSGFTAAGAVGAVTTLVVAAIGVLVSAGFAFLIAKVVAMLFGDDLGGFGELALRAAGFAMAAECIMIALGMMMEPMFVMVVSLPAVLVLAAWLFGMNMLQAMVFTIASTAIKFALGMILAGVLLGMVAGSMGG